MSEHTGNLDRLLVLAGMACDEDATTDELEELDALAVADHDACRRYLEYCRMHEMLRLDLCAYRATQAIHEQIGIRPNPVGLRELGAIEPSTPDAITPGISATLFHSACCYLSSGWPVAYLIATAILGIGALIGVFVPVSQPVQFAKQSVSLPSLLSPVPSVVGQVTGTVDCKRNGADLHSFRVCLGDTYDLASGLMEITYRTGAKVILQGPATYVVDAKNGGFVSIGKLTGIMDAPDAKGFTVRTPTAVVADLGTEFAVEVDKKGNTTSHVFRGTVSMHAIGDKGTESDAAILHANESARTERASGDSRHVNVHRVTVNPDTFVRRLQNAPQVNVLAWFRMGEDEPNARAGAPAGKDIHSHNKYVRLERHGSPTYSADTDAPGSVLSMTFHGGSDGERFRTSRFPFVANDYFILEAWVKMHKVGSEPQVVAASGQGAQNGYCLAVVDGRWHGALEAIAWIDSGVACEIGNWTHLALVCERGKSQLWVNGMPAGKVIDALSIMPDGRFTIGGRPENPQCVFDGEIDEVRLSTFIAPFRPEMLLLRKIEPAK